MLNEIMRSNQRWLMIVVCIIMSLSLVWFFSNRTQVDRMVSDRVGSIYGRSLTTTEIERIRREIQTAGDLGLPNLTDREIIEGGDMTAIAVTHIVLLHQAQVMGIVPGDDEVLEAEKRLAVFQGPGGFDSGKYAEFVTDKLGPRGFTETQLDDLVREDLQFGKLRQIVGAPVCLSPIEIRTAFEQTTTKTDVSIVPFHLSDLTAGITISEADIKKYFADQSSQQNLQQPEKRQVEYVRFVLDDTQKKLTDPKARRDALQPQADGAAQFLEKLLDAKGKDAFADLAKQENRAVATTADFEQNATAGLPEAAIPGFVAAAFRLTQHDPDSDVPLETRDGFYVLHLTRVQPERPLTLDEARPQVVKALQDERARTALSAKAEEVRTKIVEALKAGATFGAAVVGAGQTAQDVPAFSPEQPPTVPDGRDIVTASLELGRGEVSKFVPTSDGGLLVYLRGREPSDESAFVGRQQRLNARLSEQKERFYFYEWLKQSKESAKLQLAPGQQLSDEG